MTTAKVVVQVPGNAPTLISNVTGGRGEAERWASWRVRKLTEEGFDVLAVTIRG